MNVYQLDIKSEELRTFRAVVIASDEAEAMLLADFDNHENVYVEIIGETINQSQRVVCMELL